MLGTEHIPAAPAMVPPFEDAETFLADGEIADGGIGIGFPVRVRGGGGYGGQVFEGRGGQGGAEGVGGDVGEEVGGFGCRADDDGGAGGGRGGGGRREGGVDCGGGVGAVGGWAAPCATGLLFDEGVGAAVEGARWGQRVRAKRSVGGAEGGGDVLWLFILAGAGEVEIVGEVEGLSLALSLALALVVGVVG